MAFVVNQTYQRTRGHVVVLTAIARTNLLFFEPLFCELCCYSLCCETNSRRKSKNDLNAGHSSCLSNSIRWHIHIDGSGKIEWRKFMALCCKTINLKRESKDKMNVTATIGTSLLWSTLIIFKFICIDFCNLVKWWWWWESLVLY